MSDSRETIGRTPTWMETAGNRVVDVVVPAASNPYWTRVTTASGMVHEFRGCSPSRHLKITSRFGLWQLVRVLFSNHRTITISIEEGCDPEVPRG